MNNNKKAKGLLMIPAVIGIFFLISALVMVLWNAILPEVTGVKNVTFWQAAGILALSKILFGGFKGGNHRLNQWKERKIQERIKGFTPEEQEKFRQKLKERFGASPFCRKN